MIGLIPESLKLFAAGCDKSFLAFPTWYKYLPGSATCEPRLTQINDIWLILLAIIEILLRVAILAAITFVLIGGFKFITSRANPDKTTAAKNTTIDALIGLVIAIVATAVVSFVAGRFS
jgi:hypothetical protein